jgi:transposase
MRGHDHQQSDMYSYLSPEQRVRENHPLRKIRAMADEALQNMSERFEGMYAKTGRPSIPPEKLLRAQLIQMLYSIRSERLLMEEIDYSMLFRWFVGMNLDEPVWDATVFTKNRNRLLEGDVAREFLGEVVAQAQAKGLTSDEHFTVDGTLIEAWASLKSFQRKDQKNAPPPDDPGNPSVDFHGEKRSNDTHESTTDPDALLARKGNGKEAKLSYNERQSYDRKPERADREHGSVSGQRHGGTGCRVSDAGAGSRSGPCNSGSRQGIRHQRLRCRVSEPERHAARGAEPAAQRRERHRRSHHAACRIRGQPTQAEAHRRVLRVAEDHCANPQGAASRTREGRVGIYVRGGCV